MFCSMENDFSQVSKFRIGILLAFLSNGLSVGASFVAKVQDLPPGDICMIRGLIGLIVFAIILQVSKDFVIPKKENRIFVAFYTLAAGIKVKL